MEITYRQIAESDNLAVAKMIRAIFIEHNAPQNGTVFSDPTTDNLYQLFQTPKSILWVAEVDGEIKGCCGLYPTVNLPENCVELVKFYIAAEARGIGIGKELMQRCFIAAQEFHYTQIYLESLPHFAKALNIYEKQGFVKISQPLGCSGHGGCDIWMIKNLTKPDK